jgi:hypothetical protein
VCLLTWRAYNSLQDATHGEVQQCWASCFTPCPPSPKVRTPSNPPPPPHTYPLPCAQVEPVPSLLRGFSAPVKLVVDGQTDEHLKLMFAHDSDQFNR